VGTKVDILGADFAPADRAAWLRLVEKTLGGATFGAKLVAKTAEGMEIQPLYGPTDAVVPLDADLRARRPFDAFRAWDMRALVEHPDPETARLEALADLEGGSTSLLVKIDPSGQDGVAAASVSDLAHVLSDVLFDLAPVALDAGFLGVAAAEWLNQIATARTLRPRLQLHLDPVTAFAAAGEAPGPIDAHVRQAAEASGRIWAESAFLATGRSVHESGGGDALEIAFMAAAGLAYLKAQAEAGTDVHEGARRTVLGVSVDADYFTSIAKIRAARAVWRRIVTAAGGGAGAVRIEARASRRMLATLDPWVNMLRLTAACFAGGVGGADAVVLEAFTQPLGIPTAFARRQRRNIQLVLMDEAHVGRVADPAGGAYFVEALTQDLAKAAWSAFQEIERHGGVLTSLSTGLVEERVAAVRNTRSDWAAKRRLGLVGVSEFPALGQAPVETAVVDAASFAKAAPRADLAGPASLCPPLSPWRPASLFETVRARAEAMVSPPLAHLAVVGEAKDAAARTGFMVNALAAGGIGARTGPVGAFAPEETPIAILCGSDAAYGKDGPAAAGALASAGARRIYGAGRPGALEADLRAAGVHDFVFAGSHLPTVLTAMLDAFEGKV